MFKDRLPTLIRFSEPQTARIDEEPVKRVKVPVGNGRFGYREIYKQITIVNRSFSIPPFGEGGEFVDTIRVRDLVVTVTYRGGPPTNVQKWGLSCILHELKNAQSRNGETNKHGGSL